MTAGGFGRRASWYGRVKPPDSSIASRSARLNTQFAIAPRPGRQTGRRKRAGGTHRPRANHPPDQPDIASSAMPFVRGPINPIADMTIAIAAAINTNTPAVPNPFNTAAIAKDVKIAENRLHE